jgi:hypothetical protein
VCTNCSRSTAFTTGGHKVITPKKDCLVMLIRMFAFQLLPGTCNSAKRNCKCCQFKTFKFKNNLGIVRRNGEYLSILSVTTVSVQTQPINMPQPSLIHDKALMSILGCQCSKYANDVMIWRRHGTLFLIWARNLYFDVFLPKTSGQ